MLRHTVLAGPIALLLFVHPIGVRAASMQDVTLELVAPRQGDQQVSGFVSPPDRAPRTLVLELLESKDGQVHLTGRFVLDEVNARTGAFTFTLPAPLKATTLRVKSVDGALLAERAVQDKTPAKPPSAPTLSALMAGQKEVRGFANRETETKSAVVQMQRMQAVEVADLETPERLRTVRRLVTIDRQLVTQFDVTGGFTLTIARPLITGDRLSAAGCSDDKGAECGAAETYDVADATDWGRARAYFSGGVVFSQERDEFSQQDLFLAFVMDKAWLQREDPDPETREGQIDPPARHRWVWPRQFNTFFDVRLTALPVVAASTDASDTANATTRAAAAATTPDTVDQFVSSRKGALAQIGAYAPFYGAATTWQRADGPHALFIAPVFRVGFQTIPNGGQSNEARAIGADNVFKFWSGGFGVGLLRLTGTRDRAPEVISYLHLTWGHYEAFESLASTGTSVRPAKSLRTVAEGRLKIPETPLQVGFDANLGEGRDDVRFSFGVRFDIGDLFAKLKQFQ